MSSALPSNRTSTSNLRLRIINTATGQAKVSMTLPVNLINVAQRLGAQLLPHGVTIETVFAQAEHDGVAHLSWDAPEHGERLEITIE